MTVSVCVTTDHSDDFWTREENDKYCHLRMHSLDRRHSDGDVTWRDINVISSSGEKIDLRYGELLFDGNMNIILNNWHNKAVHVFVSKWSTQPSTTVIREHQE